MTAHEREPLPDTRRSVTHKAIIDSDQGPVSLFMTAGFYEDGRLGEVFVQAGKQGSTVRGLLDDFARLLSYALQYGVPLADLAEKFRGANYPPQGATRTEAIPVCTSLTDYVVRWLAALEHPEGSL